MFRFSVDGHDHSRTYKLQMTMLVDAPNKKGGGEGCVPCELLVTVAMKQACISMEDPME